MNLNVKLDGEEEQPLQYVNRFAINIPSGAAAFNLNIVNPGLGNQSYILNPVNPVGQNIVAYQPPMALQSYIALPTEAEGNIIHSLPVGVPVVSGLPVPTGLLQNNFVNTSIIIGNEDCNSSNVIKSSSNNLNPENEIKVNYIEKPVEELASSKANGTEVQKVGVNCSSQTNAETVVKKPCPLEMSIKAANIDIEFEKCEPEVPILLANCQAVVEKPLLVENMPLEPELKDNLLKVPSGVSSVQTPNVEAKETESKKIKTEITWENNNKQETVDNGFQESLICEVEEANDDDDDDDDDDDEEEKEEDEEEEEEVEEEEEEDDDDDDDEDEDESDMEEDINSNCKAAKSGDYSSEAFSSSEESDSLPLSVALKLNKSNKPSHRKKRVKGKISNEKLNEENRGRKKSSKHKKQREEDDENGEEEEEKEEDGEDWSESDDDVLNLKRIKNEFNYKCFYQPNSTKSATSLVLKIDDKFKKFVRVRSCCSKRECGKKISVQDQKTAHKNFYDLESNTKRDAYLMNCIEHVQKNKSLENAKDKTEEKTNIQLEIENESNGNQKLSDEIQKAINESLKDCVANEGSGGEVDLKDEGAEKGEKNTWNFYIVIDRCRKKVCLQFLLKLFQITKSRIKQLQKKTLSGTPLTDETGKGSQKLSEVWEVAKLHLDGLNGAECTHCIANPRHRFLAERRTKEDLFDSFKEYYFNKLGREPNIKYASYKRFLDKKTSISFCTKKEGVCTECEELKRHKKRKQNKTEKSSKKKDFKRQWVIKTDSEDNSSDDEPLLKRKKLKLTIPLKAVNNKTQQNAVKRKSKKYSVENKSKGKSKQTGSRGRDVWSLMLLHLETMPYKECKSCVSKKKHRYLDSSFTTQGLFEDYRKYFLKETNSELGLGFTMYEKYFNKNCNYMISDVNVDAPSCPRCTVELAKS